jgi:hypothetical protein
MSRKRRRSISPTSADLDAAVDAARSVLLRENSADGLAQAERVIGVAWPGLTPTDKGYVLGYALASLRERTRLLQLTVTLATPAEGFRRQ